MPRDPSRANESPHSAGWLSKLEAERQRIADGKALMSRELLIDLINSLSGGLGPWIELDEYYEQYDEQVERWTSVSRPEWVSIGLDLLAHPPAAEALRGKMRERWISQCALLLAEVAERFPESAPELAARWLSHPGSRLCAMRLVSMAPAPWLMEWLRPLIDEPDLTREECLALASILGARGGKAGLEGLQRIGTRIEPAPADSVRAGGWDDWQRMRRTYVQSKLWSFLARHMSEQHLSEFLDSMVSREAWSAEELGKAISAVEQLGGDEADEVLGQVRAALA